MVLTLQRVEAGLSEGGRRVILLMGRHEDQSWESLYTGRRRGSRAAGRSRAEIKGWCSGLCHRPKGTELQCTPAAGF